MSSCSGRRRWAGAVLSQLYDTIGTTYADTRQPDPRIERQIGEALGDATSVANVGAGAGSYEPADREVIAVELSATMIRQRPHGSASAVQATAEALPLASGSVDAAMAVLTVHHWKDRARGLAEMRRVARKRAVVLTWDQQVWEDFWLAEEYLPCIWEIDRPQALPVLEIAQALSGGGRHEIIPVPVPHDCIDGFFGAFWRRPRAYLDPRVQAGISSFAKMREEQRDQGLRRLEVDLASGAWEERHRDLLELEELDLGYRLIVASCSSDSGAEA